MVPKHVPELAHEVMKSSAATNGEGVTRDDGDRDNKAADEGVKKEEGHVDGDGDAVDRPTPTLAVGRCVPKIDSTGEVEGSDADAEPDAASDADEEGDGKPVTTVRDTVCDMDGDASAEGLHTAPVNTTDPESPAVDAVPVPTNVVTEFVTNPGNVRFM